MVVQVGLLLVVGLLAGGIGSFVFRPAPSAPNSIVADAEEQDSSAVAARRALERESRARERLAREVNALRARLDLLSALVATPAPGEKLTAAEPSVGPAREGEPPGFRADLLEESGLHPEEVADLRAQWSTAEMAKQHVSDQAAREGWAESHRHHEALRAVDNELRAELDEFQYDWYLYAVGRPNRVEVSRVIEGSPAAEAGLRAGDQILRYDGLRVFTSFELRDSISWGEPGETVPVDILRDGEERQFLLPREPLGILSVLKRERPHLP